MFYILSKPHNKYEPYEKIDSKEFEGSVKFYMTRCKDFGYSLYGPFRDIEECEKSLKHLYNDMLRSIIRDKRED